MNTRRLISPIIASLLVWSVTAACDSSEPGEGLFDRLARARREEREAEMTRRVQLEKEKMRAKVEMELELERQRSGLTVTLPKGAASDIDVTIASIVIDVPVSGDVVIGGKAMRDEDLDNLFRAAFLRDKGTQVVIKADRGVAHGKVVNLMERAKAAGLTRLAIGTAP